MVWRGHEARLPSLHIISHCHLHCGFPEHPTLHPMNKSMLVVHNRARAAPWKGGRALHSSSDLLFAADISPSPCMLSPTMGDYQRDKTTPNCPPGSRCIHSINAESRVDVLCLHFSLERCGEAMKSGISGNPGRTMSSFSLSDYLGRLMLTGCLRYLIWVTVHTSFMSLLYWKCSISQLQIQLLQFD